MTDAAWLNDSEGSLEGTSQAMQLAFRVQPLAVRIAKADPETLRPRSGPNEFNLQPSPTCPASSFCTSSSLPLHWLPLESSHPHGSRRPMGGGGGAKSPSVRDDSQRYLLFRLISLDEWLHDMSIIFLRVPVPLGRSGKRGSNSGLSER